MDDDIDRVFVDGQYVFINDLVALDETIKAIDGDWGLLPDRTEEVLTRARRIVEFDPSQRENLGQLVRWASGHGLVQSVQTGATHFDELYEGLKEIFGDPENP